MNLSAARFSYNDYYQNFDSHWRDICAEDKSKYYASSIKYLSKFEKNHDLSIADYGAGLGQLKICLQKFHSISNQFDCFEFAQSALSVDIFPLGDYFHTLYGITICCHVLEHVSAPLDLLKLLLSNSKYLIIEVPLELNLSNFRPYVNASGHIQFFSMKLFDSILHLSDGLIIKKIVYNPSFKSSTYRRLSLLSCSAWLLKEITLKLLPASIATLFFTYHYHIILSQKDVVEQI